MVNLKKYDLAGKEIGKVAIDDALLEHTAHSQMIKDYIIAIRANARQWSACTKTRAQVNHTGKKPHPQKGQGRARQGSLASPQYKGGGRAWGPKPKFDQHVRINKKERRAAIRAMLAEKLKGNQAHVLHLASMDGPKTKKVAGFMKTSGLGRKRVLFLGKASSDKDGHFLKSIRNLPRAKYLLAPNINGYELALCQELVILDGAMDNLLAILEQRGQS